MRLQNFSLSLQAIVAVNVQLNVGKRTHISAGCILVEVPYIYGNETKAFALSVLHLLALPLHAININCSKVLSASKQLSIGLCGEVQ